MNLKDQLAATPVDQVIDAIAAWATAQFPAQKVLIGVLDGVLKALADSLIKS